MGSNAQNPPTLSGWTCTSPAPPLHWSPCSQAGFASQQGTITDTWGFNTDSLTPPSGQTQCGYSNVADTWYQYLGPGTAPNVLAVGYLYGYINNKSISIEGYVSPTTKLPVGTVITVTGIRP